MHKNKPNNDKPTYIITQTRQHGALTKIACPLPMTWLLPTGRRDKEGRVMVLPYGKEGTEGREGTEQTSSAYLLLLTAQAADMLPGVCACCAQTPSQQLTYHLSGTASLHYCHREASEAAGMAWWLSQHK